MSANRLFDTILGIWTEWKGTNGVGHVHIASSNFAVIPPFAAQMFNGTAAGSTVTANLQDYNDWTFQITFADATNTIQILGSLDDGTYIPLSLLNLATGAVLTTIVATAGDMYKIGCAANTPVKPIAFKSIKVTKGGAGTTATTVSGFGGWAA